MSTRDNTRDNSLSESGFLEDEVLVPHCLTGPEALNLLGVAIKTMTVVSLTRRGLR